MDSLRNIEVKTNHLASSQSLFSQERFDHAAVSINKRIIILGGYGSSSERSGEIVNEGKAQITFTSLVMIHSWKTIFILLIVILFDSSWVAIHSSKFWMGNMSAAVQDRLCHNWGWLP